MSHAFTHTIRERTSFLGSRGVLNRDYKKWMLAQTEELVRSVDRYAREQCGRSITPLSTWRHDKEQLARKRQEQTGIDTGLIGAWSRLEGCWSYRANYCAEKGYPQLHRYTTQCKHLYLYFDHEEFGWMNVRLQTWFPYHIQIAPYAAFVGKMAAKRGPLPTVISSAITVTDQAMYQGVCKAAMELVGKPMGRVREPMENLTAAEKKELRGILKKMGAPVL